MTEQGRDAVVTVGIDGSEHSRRALAWASAEARHRGARLHIVHALPSERLLTGSGDPGLRTEAQRMLDDAARVPDLVHESVETTTEVLDGGAAKALVEQSRHSSLLVMGSRGYGGFASLMLGSTAVDVTAHAECPVAVVPTLPVPGDPGPIVVGVDASEGANRAMEFGMARARDRGAKLVAMHVWKPPTAFSAYSHADLLRQGDRPVRDLETRLSAALQPWQERFPEVEVEQRVVRGQAVAELAEASGQGAEMVVVGTRGRTALSGMVLGSVSQGVLHHASGPVVVAR